MIVNPIESILQDELTQHVAELRAYSVASAGADSLVELAREVVLLPLRVARGEDTTAVADAAAARWTSERVAVADAVSLTWERAAMRIVGAALGLEVR